MMTEKIFFASLLCFFSGVLGKSAQMHSDVRVESINAALEAARGSFGDIVPAEITPEQYRELAYEGYLKLCGVEYNPGEKTKNHVVVNVNRNNKATLNWIPPDGESFCVFVKEEEHDKYEVILNGTVVPFDTKKYGSEPLHVNAKFTVSSDWESCWCSSEEVAKDPLDPHYGKVEKKCTLDKYMNREDESLLFCPKCDQGLCKEAGKKSDELGAPNPIYKDWVFFSKVEGKFYGPGLGLLRQEIFNSFPAVNPNLLECTLDITNIPVPQFGCSDLSNPLNGYGYGVNAKNFECGFASWFNCLEDIDALGGVDNLKVHTLDINFNLIPCPTPAPTAQPTPKGICKRVNTSEIDCVELDGDFCPEEIFIPGR
mmetsp:Transcript_3720/g.5039  ORF Transcript_3720/g.5039 Transcript_3720/m.5039 type:complete len:370 (-) Transcript_3720:98-1207(-)